MKTVKKPNFENLKNMTSKQGRCFSDLCDTIHDAHEFLVKGYGNYHQRLDAKKKIEQAKIDMVFLLA